MTATNLDLLNLIINEIREIKENIKELHKIYEQEEIDIVKLIDDLVKEETNLLPPEDTDNRNYTITEWLRECKGIIDIELSLRSKLAIMASQNYKTLKGTDPEKDIRKHSNGRINNGVTVYYSEDLPILELAFNRLFIKK